MEEDELPPPEAVAKLAEEYTQKLHDFDTYLFPPIVQYETISAEDYIRSITDTQSEKREK